MRPNADTEVLSFQGIHYDMYVEVRPDGNYIVLQLDEKTWSKGPLEDSVEDLQVHCESGKCLLNNFFKEA